MSESPVDIWGDDLLDRKADAEWLATFLTKRSKELQGQSRSFALNLDAAWGIGKTFFLERFRRQLEAEGHVAVYVNAWADDFADDPLVAVMAAIDATVKAKLPATAPARKYLDKARKAAGPVAREIGKGLFWRGASFALTAGGAAAVQAAIADAGDAAEAEAGGAAKSIVDVIEKRFDKKAEDAVSEFNAGKAAIATFRQRLSEFIAAIEKEKGIAPPFFVLVDELDRCRPPYAIAMLERIKHLFEIPNVVFVVATDSEQLVHSIRAVYGQEFNGTRYLTRFFDLTYAFAPANTLQLVKAHLNQIASARLLNAPFDIGVAEVTAAFFDEFQVNTRTIVRCLERIGAIATGWVHDRPLELIVLLPLVVAADENARLLELPLIKAIDQLQGRFRFWSVSYRNRPQRGTSTVQGLDLAHRLATAAQDLAKAASQNSSDQPGQYVLRTLRDEFMRLHGGIHQDEPIPSIILDYPMAIRRAGNVGRVGGKIE